MSIDPRTMQQLLKLELLNRMDLIASGGNSSLTDGSDSDFADLLQSLLASSAMTSGGSAKAAPAAASPRLTAASLQARAAAAAPGIATNEGASAYEPYIAAAGQRYGVATSLIKAVIAAESSFNPRAVSSAGAKGLMQLMDGTGQGLGVTDPFDPAQNIDGGTRFLAGLLKKYNGNRSVALAAYNAGPARIDSLGITNDAELAEKYYQLPKETQSYVRKVLALERRYGGYDV